MKIKVVYNRRKPWSRKVSEQVISFLSSKGFMIAGKGAGVTICIGGDGTIFYNNFKGNIEGLILGIGSETSHICVLKKDSWKGKILRLLKNMNAQERISLDVSVSRKTYHSINDVVLHTLDYRVISIEYSINKERHDFQGDGLIVSTPTGSTAYAYSAGGTVIDEQAKAIEVVPVCPYKRKVSPVVINDDSTVVMKSDRVSDLVIDGIYVKKLNAGELVEVKKGRTVKFLV